ncbi:MAG: hypothetical protein M3071_16365 [Actinomycetota bacterium]|nr:hypothetical protein [Actinomycetota bacterium]
MSALRDSPETLAPAPVPGPGHDRRRLARPDSTPYPYPPPAIGPAWFGVPSLDQQGVRDVVGGLCTTQALDSGTDGSISEDRGPCSSL